MKIGREKIVTETGNEKSKKIEIKKKNVQLCLPDSTGISAASPSAFLSLTGAPCVVLRPVRWQQLEGLHQPRCLMQWVWAGPGNLHF